MAGRQFKAVAGALAADGKGLQRKRKVVRRRCRARQIEHTRHRSVHRDPHRNIGLDEGEPVVVGQMSDVGPAPGREVVDADDLVTAGEELVAEMGAEESRATEDSDASAHLRPIPT